MKILVYGINYAPELTGIGKYTAEMAATLQAQGHDVRVVCAPPYYPEWRVGKGYSALRYGREHRDGVALWRAPLWVPNRPRGVRRIVHLASFAASSLPVVLAHALWRPDVVMCIAPSMLNAPAAWLVARLCRAHAWIHIQDYEVDAAFQLGMLNGSLLKRTALWVERTLLRRFDTVSTISKKMLERAADKGVAPARLVHFPNWADVAAIRPLGRRSALRETFRIPADATVVLYSGNMGVKQGLEVLAAAAVELVDREDIVFVFCGNGPVRDAIHALCGPMKNCRFSDLRPAEELNELMNLADIHVLPQRHDAADLVMPSKLTGMFASERPVIAMAQSGTELYEVVAPRGWVIPPGDGHTLAQAIERLADDAPLRAELGQMGRAFAQAVLSREAVLGEFSNTLHARVSAKARRRARESAPIAAAPVEMIEDSVADTDVAATR
ncbi:glycosyltransferase WbuB [Trinickia diaoshuihuensis]|uniref:glycosyltransferase WbuB n=1 Tax=Trinickia diaoshuihuensis TaxID=2292265 RepID=UPI000E277031|nr:glycosyltransferase WbuB [Trinickia diaoshuihuensis]